MRTRNADKPKPSPAAKPAPAAKKSAVKTPQKPPEPSAESSETPKSSGTKRTRAIQAKNKQTQNASTPIVEEAVKKPATVKKVTRAVKRKVGRKRTPSSAKRSAKPDDSDEDESSKEEGEDFVEPAEDKEVIPVNVEEPAQKREVNAVDVEEAAQKREAIPMNVEESDFKEVIPVNVEAAVEHKEEIPVDIEESENREVIPANVEEPVENKEVNSVDVDMKEASAELVGQSPGKEDVEDAGKGGSENKESVLVNAEEYKSTEPLVEHEESVKEDVVLVNQDVVNMEEVAVGTNLCAEDEGICQVQKDAVAKDEDLTVMEKVNTLTSQEPVTIEEVEVKKVTEITEIDEVKTDATSEPVTLDEMNTGMIIEDEPSELADMDRVDIKTEAKEVNTKTEVVEGGMDTTELVHMEKITTEELKEDETFEQADKKIEEQAGEDVSKELAERVHAQDDRIEHGEKAQGSEEEHVEITAMAEERRRRKELEIFVGGLDRDAVDEDVRKVFQHIGEVVEVQVHKDPSNSKNKGYAFVKFATKEQAKQALAEIKNPVINGKRCGTAPCEDNDTLFLGNICNTWTKEAIRQKLKDYGVDGVETITLVSDPKHEGLSRGFAFVEFSCHGDAMLAFNRLQKPDVIFGHLERTAKVAFAKPLREPDPEVMAQVKSVFVDGLPPHWNEDQVRMVFKGYGDIEQITLASNISSSKRKDFGFVDFSTHEAAVACIDDVNSREVGEGNLKAKVKARLSNPLPKTQAVKGEMCGGFRIGRVDSSNITHSGRGSVRGAYSFSRTNSQRGRELSHHEFSHHGHGQTSRTAFPHSHGLGEPFRGTGSFGQGGRWGSSRGAHVAPGEGSIAARFNVDRPWHGAMDRVHERHMPFRGQPFPPEAFDRPFPERRFDDPYLYNDRTHGTKRPHFTYQDPRYMEPSRVRPRLDYTDPATSFHRPPHQDTYRSGTTPYPHDYRAPNSNPYPRDHYGPNVRAHGSVQYSGRGDIRPPFYGGARPHRGGYYH